MDYQQVINLRNQKYKFEILILHINLFYLKDFKVVTFYFSKKNSSLHSISFKKNPANKIDKIFKISM